MVAVTAGRASPEWSFVACVGCEQAGSWFVLACEGLVRFEGDDGSVFRSRSWLVKIEVGC